MPVADDWRTCPRNLVEKIYQERAAHDNWESTISSTFKELLSCESTWNGLPSLNQLPNHEVADGQLVRFRGMVQDMFNPEIYLSEFEIRNLSTGSSSVNCGRYRDVLCNSLREEILGESDLNVMKDRNVVYCVSIPAESPWVADIHAAKSGNKAGPSGTFQNPLKRGLEPGAAVMTALNERSNGHSSEENMDVEMDTENGDGVSGGKRSKGEDGSAVASNHCDEPTNVGITNIKHRHDLNLPIPNNKGKAVIVKLYDVEEGTVKLNDLIDLVGIVSLDPALANMDSPDGNQADILPPPSLVPRLHAVHMKKITQNNPLYGAGCPKLSSDEMVKVRDELMYILTQATLGDALAAEYLLYHLISKVHGRRDIQVLGKMCLNLFNFKNNNSWLKRLYTLLSLLVPGAHFLPLSRQHLDTANFVPVKDFEANRLVAGVLQLPAGTNLVVDETAMSDGQLTARGLQNLTAVGNLIRWQKLDYDFKYNSLEYETDVQVLVLSECRSLLPSDFQLKVTPDESLLDTNFRNIGSILNQDLLNRIRVYLTQCRDGDYSLPEQVQTAVTDDFVQLRRQNPNQFTAEDLHTYLTLARLVTLSYGKSRMEGEIWPKVKQLEANRRENRAPPQQRAQASALANGMPIHISAMN